jgi:hypothetical protein
VTVNLTKKKSCGNEKDGRVLYNKSCIRVACISDYQDRILKDQIHEVHFGLVYIDEVYQINDRLV